MPSVVFSADKMDGLCAHKTKRKATLPAPVFGILLDNLTGCQRRLQFFNDQTIRQTLLISMERYLVSLTFHCGADEIGR